MIFYFIGTRDSNYTLVVAFNTKARLLFNYNCLRRPGSHFASFGRASDLSIAKGATNLLDYPN